METFVLVHGAWGGGWQWKFVAEHLRAAGHLVYAPSLTGLGDRAHLASPSVGLDTHIADIVNVLHYEDISEVVLVGWSYGGMVITGVLDQCPEHLKHVVYLDAVIPEDGQASIDSLPPAARESRLEQARLHGEGWQVPLNATEEHFSGAIPDERMRHWFYVREVPHPLRCFLDPVRIVNSVPDRVKRTFVRCTADAGASERALATVRRIRSDPSWQYREIPASHFAPLTMPREVADLLLEAAS